MPNGMRVVPCASGHGPCSTTKCATCCSVKVFFNGTSLGTFNLASSTTARKQLIPVKTFTSVQSGTLKIQVVSPTGKTVYMDGVVLRAF